MSVTLSELEHAFRRSWGVDTTCLSTANLAARFEAYATGQAACVAHVPEHDLGAAAHAIRPSRRQHQRARRSAGQAERDWQRQQIPDHLRTLVLEDQSRRNSICWSMFDD